LQRFFYKNSKTMQKILKISLFAFALFSFAACATKKTGKQTAFAIAYHNITGHFNYFFNAREIIGKSKKNLANNYKDNYNKVLEMYREAAVESAQDESPNLDDAIKRAGVNATLHSRSDWADDSYLLIGRAQYLKKEYKEAEATFQYMINEFNPKKLALINKEKPKKAAKKPSTKPKTNTPAKNNSKKPAPKKPAPKKSVPQKNAPKKVEPTPKTPLETPKSNTKRDTAVKVMKKDDVPRDENGKKIRRRAYFLKHRPVREDAMLWLARTYVEMNRFDEAETMLTRLKNDHTLPKVLWRQLPAIESYSELRQKNYAKAIETLTEAIKRTTKRSEKTRYTYILAQLYDLEKNTDGAYMAYKKVLKLNPDFDMEFNTKLNMANNAFQSGKMTQIETVAMLRKMLRESKYEEHYDQIYYTLGKMAMSNKDDLMAVDYFKKSILANKTDKNQKAESYYILAEYYWTAEKFAFAKRYYDSTEQNLNKADDRFTVVHQRATELTEIAKNIDLVTLNDSLLRIAAMSETERAALATKIISKQRADAKEKAIAEAIAAANNQAEGRVADNINTNNMMPTVGAASVAQDGGTNKWWAYDETLRKKAQRDFEKKWGKRKRTDDWRRSERKANDQEVEDNNGKENGADKENKANIVEKATVDEADITDFFAGIPKTDAEIAALRKANTEALYKTGDLFRLRMNMPKNSARAHEDLLARKPTENPHEQEVFYTLYLNFSDLKNAQKTNYYRNLLLDKHPNSVFAKVVSDPNYLANEKKKAQVLNVYYQKTLKLYRKDSVFAALANINQADSLFGKDNKLAAKFTLLNALCRGSLNGKDDYIASLKGVQTKHPKTMEADYAAMLLEELQNTKKPKTNKIDKETIENAEFGYTPEVEHYIVVWLKEEGATDRLTDYRIAVTDYNTKYYNIKALKTAALTPDLTTALIVIRRFDDAAIAQTYIKGLQSKADEFFGEKKVQYSAMAMSSANYVLLLKGKPLADYEAFYKQNYK
jgi:tetratricopeptide (TPR) repeat protein